MFQVAAAVAVVVEYRVVGRPAVMPKIGVAVTINTAVGTIRNLAAITAVTRAATIKELTGNNNKEPLITKIFTTPAAAVISSNNKPGISKIRTIINEVVAAVGAEEAEEEEAIITDDIFSVTFFVKFVFSSDLCNCPCLFRAKRCD